MNDLQAGIDVSKATFDVRLLMRTLAGLRDLGKSQFPNDAEGARSFLRWSVEASGGELPFGRIKLHVVMEATGVYSSRLSKFLRKAAGEFDVELLTSIANPLQISHYAKSLGLKTGSDSIDAGAIALFGVERKPAPTEEPSQERESLRGLVRARADIIAQRTAMKNRLESVEPASPAEKAYASLLKAFEKEIAKLEKLMDKAVKSSREISSKAVLLDSIPGVGLLTAATIVAELGDLSRFKSRSELVAFAGLNPLSKTSGSSVRRKGRISKHGSPEVRRVLYLAVSAAVNKCSEPNAFKVQHERLIASGKPYYLAICAGMRKMLLIARALLISSQAFSAKGA